MERNIKLLLEYEGTRYHGWQWQDNAVTVQGKLEEAIYKLTGEQVRVAAAGRTDAGVHARGQVANFKINNSMPLYKIERGLNSHLPGDIVVKSATEVSQDFNARFSAKKRVYHYYIAIKRTALMRNFCWQFFQKLDTDVLNPIAEILLGDHDFAAFARLESHGNHKRCIVYESYWFQKKEFWIYRIVANRFLQGMVRSIVGTMIDVARNRLTFDDFKKIFASRNRLNAGPAAPAKGLVLEEVIY